MDFQHITIKLFAERADFELHELIPVFHQWIQRKELPDLLLIDVADYAHVPNGPGVMLIAHEGHVSFDMGAVQTDAPSPGVVYANKRLAQGSTKDRITHALRQAVGTASLLQNDKQLAGKATFDPSRLLIRFDDFLHVANDDQSFEAVKADVTAALESVYGDASISLTRHDNVRTGLTLEATITPAPSVAELASALSSN